MTDDLERRRYGSRGLAEALRNLRDAARRPPTDADRPPAGVLPLTPAAREALRTTRELEAGVPRPRLHVIVRGADGELTRQPPAAANVVPTGAARARRRRGSAS